MRNSKATGWNLPSRQGWLRALKLCSVACGVLLVVPAGAARAEDDDDDDDKTFEEKLIENIMGGLGAKNMEKPGIDYRERSPLVVPPKLDLPPPTESAKAAAPNWPKDPDEKRRREAAAARKKANAKASRYGSGPDARLLTPSEMNAGTSNAKPIDTSDPNEPGRGNNLMMSPSQLGYSGGILGFFKGNSNEQTEFKGEPPRTSLVEPPAGYQTPSPNYAYGSRPDMSKKTYYDIQSGKEREQ